MPGLDPYIESDAEEIYVPERSQRNDQSHNNHNLPMLKGFGSGANEIVGYQKYIHQASRIAQDNTN